MNTETFKQSVQWWGEMESPDEIRRKGLHTYQWWMNAPGMWGFYDCELVQIKETLPDYSEKDGTLQSVWINVTDGRKTVGGTYQPQNMKSGMMIFPLIWIIKNWTDDTNWKFSRLEDLILQKPGAFYSQLSEIKQFKREIWETGCRKIMNVFRNEYATEGPDLLPEINEMDSYIHTFISTIL